MLINYHERTRLLQEFPNIKLSYVKNVHKKVYTANLYLVIPKGLKYFAWFRFYKNKPVCFFLQIGKSNTIKNISIYNCCFNLNLCSETGTILYGTHFKNNSCPFFSIEDIFYLKGKFVGNNTLLSKLNMIKNLFVNYIKQVALSKNDTIIGLPIMSSSRYYIDSLVENLQYEIYCIQHRFLHDNNKTFYNEKIITNTSIIKTFLIKPENNCDIYSLYFYNEDTKSNEFHDNALIPNYKTSVKMNTIFRNIKENINLDYLEESDSEDEFENISEDKYIKIKSKIIDCVYNLKFKLWVPVNISKNKISYKNDILRIEKNNR
jgi:hypothetical protein|tara:strand:+ start:1267 stop:2223 length:957 start_codon:yes stop_codon:yes gene_type:complete